MTVTRIYQAGAEIRHINELDAYPGVVAYGITTAIISSSKAHTGAYSFKLDTNDIPRGKTFSSTTQVRANVYLNHSGVSGVDSTKNAVLWLITGSSFDILVQWAADTSTIELVVNGTIQASVNAASSGMSTTDTWYALGINVKAHTSTGWVSFYVDGVQKLTWTGNTGSSITGVYLGGRNTANTMTEAYWDDFCADDTEGESDGVPPSPRFPFLLPNGAGNYTSWSVNTGSNYEAVDDSASPDDDTTYVYTMASGTKDSYALTNTTAGVTVPSGYAIDAVIPVAWARKTDAGTATTLKIGTRLSATDVVSAAQSLGIAYGSSGTVWDRQTTKPGGGSWAESDINSAELLLESAGAF